MKIFKKILIILAVLAATILLVGFLLPSKWSVQRSIVINAPSSAIYPLVANFKTGWPQWSTFDYEDPTIKYDYAGPDQGAGATRSWVSKKMGDGSQVITTADPVSGIGFQLQMAQNGFLLNGRIACEPAGNSTKVTWTDSGEVGNNLFFRYMASLMDKMMGRTFEKSLAELKEKAETTANAKK